MFYKKTLMNSCTDLTSIYLKRKSITGRNFWILESMFKSMEEYLEHIEASVEEFKELFQE